MNATEDANTDRIAADTTGERNFIFVVFFLVSIRNWYVRMVSKSAQYCLLELVEFECITIYL